MIFIYLLLAVVLAYFIDAVLVHNKQYRGYVPPEATYKVEPLEGPPWVLYLRDAGHGNVRPIVSNFYNPKFPLYSVEQDTRVRLTCLKNKDTQK